MTTSILVNTIQEPWPLPSPLPARLSEGWHHTERWGEVFVAPGGSAWVVQQSGQHLINVTVTLNPSDIIKTPAIDRVKHALVERRRYNLALAVRKQSDLPLSEAEGVDK